MKKDTNKYLTMGISLGLCFGVCIGIIINIIMNLDNFIFCIALGAGLGMLILVSSILFRDYTVVQSVLLMFTFQFMVVNLIVDILYGVFNPKIKYE